MSEKPVQRPVVAIRTFVLDCKGSIILLKRANSKYGDGQWCLPGGKLDYNDTPEHTVVKELNEETNLSAKNIEFLFYQNSPPIQSGKMHCVNLYFQCICKGDVRLNEESSEYVWVTPEEALKYHPVFRGEDAIHTFLKLKGNQLRTDSFSDDNEMALFQTHPGKIIDEFGPQSLSPEFRHLPGNQQSRILSALCSAYLEINDIRSARQALARLKRVIPPSSEDILYLEGTIAYHTGDFAEAFQRLNQVRSTLEKVASSGKEDNRDQLVKVYDALGNTYLRDCSYGNALMWFERGLAICTSRHDRYGQARSYGHLRKLHEQASRFDLAIRYCQLQLAIFISLEDCAGECIARNTLADLYLKVGKNALARKEFERSHVIAALPHMQNSARYVWLGMARLQNAENNPEQALAYARKSLDGFSIAGDYDRQGRSWLVMADAFAQKRDIRNALLSVRKAGACFSRGNLVARRHTIALTESRIEAKRGNLKKAIACLCESIRLSYEFSGGARGEVFFRDIIQSFLSEACGITNLPWANLMVSTEGFWKYYLKKKSLSHILKGSTLSPGCEVPDCSTVVFVEKKFGLPWSGKILLAPLINRGGTWGVLMFPFRKQEDITLVELLSDVGPSLGSILEKKLAQQDALTGLANRRMFDIHFAEQVRRCTTLKQALAIIMLDIDYFGKFNKAHGHSVGDLVLAKVAGVFRTGMRLSGKRSVNVPLSEDFAARYGGEEMVIVTDNCTLHQARAAAERIRRDIETLRIPVNGKNLKVTASLGVGYTSSGHSPRKAFLLADEALHRAKENGRNRVEVSSSDTGK